MVNGGGQAVVSGGGFAPSSIQTGLKTVEIGATELAIAFWNVSGNDVTITGPNADIAAGALAFTDSAGNKLTTGTNFAVDGTAPVVTGTNATGNIAKLSLIHI